MMSKNLQWYYTLKCLIRDLLSNVSVSPKFWLAKAFNSSRGRGNETSTNIVWYLYSFRAFFVLYEAVLDNNLTYYIKLNTRTLSTTNSLMARLGSKPDQRIVGEPYVIFAVYTDCKLR